MAVNLLKGLTLGIFIATGLSAWVVLQRALWGNSTFEHLHTTLSAVITGYYRGGLTGGLLVGLCWPLHRWVLGYAALGILGVLPLYFFAGGGQPGTDSVSQRVATSLLAAFFVGSAVGVWAWTDDHPDGPGWLDALRYPTATTAARVWVAAGFVAGLSWYLVPTWSAHWPFELVILAAGTLVVVPVLTAVLVTLRAAKGDAPIRPNES